ncbi:MAG TPA: hypothetical protein VHZ04_01935 [Candidatus Paceibacterota bacterium]|jgi:hypothetical protein|nr:hypothetical protein [Candidatus Paceibacterota bacterium]
MKKKVSTKHGTLILTAVAVFAAVVIILVAVLGATTAGAPTLAPSGEYGGSMADVATNTPVYADSGDLAQGFPQQFVLDLTANIVESYTFSYPSGSEEYATTFDSSKSVQTLFSLYQTYFADNGWSVTTAAPSGMEGLYAQKGSQEVSVAVSGETSSTQVVIGYIAQ